MTDERLASIRQQIDIEDGTIIDALERRNELVREAWESSPRRDYVRENEIYKRYQDSLGESGMLVATAVLRAGRVGAAEAARNTARDTV